MFHRNSYYKKHIEETIKNNKIKFKFITTFGLVDGLISDIIIKENCTIYVLNDAKVTSLSSPITQNVFHYLEFSSSEIRAICS